jgi:plasmid stabilization system protein ParE
VAATDLCLHRKDNPTAAVRTVLAIYERTEILRQFPEMGYRYSTHSDKHIRILLFGHYRIAYLIKPDHDIDILGDGESRHVNVVEDDTHVQRP